MEDAARRLIGVMDERAEKRKTLAGGDLGPAQIRDQPAVSLAKAENADGERDLGSGSLDRRPQVAATLEDGEFGIGLEERCGQEFSGVLRRRPGEGPGITITCPRSDAGLIADRFTVQYGNVRQRDDE